MDATEPAATLEYPLQTIARFLEKSKVRFSCPSLQDGSRYLDILFPNPKDVTRGFHASFAVETLRNGTLRLVVQASIAIPTYLLKEVEELRRYKALCEEGDMTHAIACTGARYILLSETRCPIAQFEDNWERACVWLYALVVSMGKSLITVQQCAQYKVEERMGSNDKKDQDALIEHLSSSSH